ARRCLAEVAGERGARGLGRAHRRADAGGGLGGMDRRRTRLRPRRAAGSGDRPPGQGAGQPHPAARAAPRGLRHRRPGGRRRPPHARAGGHAGGKARGANHPRQPDRPARPALSLPRPRDHGDHRAELRGGADRSAPAERLRGLVDLARRPPDEPGHLPRAGLHAVELGLGLPLLRSAGAPHGAGGPAAASWVRNWRPSDRYAERHLDGSGGASLLNMRGIAWFAVPLLGTLMVACSGPGSQASPPNPTKILADAGQATSTVRSVAADVKFSGAKIQVQGLTLTSASSKLQLPGDSDTTFKVQQGDIPIDLRVVTTGGRIFVRLPFSPFVELTGQQAQEIPDVSQLFDARSGLLALLREGKDPSYQGTEQVGGVD